MGTAVVRVETTYLQQSTLFFSSPGLVVTAVHKHAAAAAGLSFCEGRIGWKGFVIVGISGGIDGYAARAGFRDSTARLPGLGESRRVLCFILFFFLVELAVDLSHERQPFTERGVHRRAVCMMVSMIRLLGGGVWFVVVAGGEWMTGGGGGPLGFGDCRQNECVFCFWFCIGSQPHFVC